MKPSLESGEHRAWYTVSFQDIVAIIIISKVFSILF